MVRTPMVHKYQLSLFLTLLVSFSAAAAVPVTTPLAPQTIKNQVESAVSYRYTSYYSSYYNSQKTYSEVADDVLASKFLTSLVKTYTLTDILVGKVAQPFFKN